MWMMWIIIVEFDEIWLYVFGVVRDVYQIKCKQLYLSLYIKTHIMSVYISVRIHFIRKYVWSIKKNKLFCRAKLNNFDFDLRINY